MVCELERSCCNGELVVPKTCCTIGEYTPQTTCPRSSRTGHTTFRPPGLRAAEDGGASRGRLRPIPRRQRKQDQEGELIPEGASMQSEKFNMLIDSYSQPIGVTC